MSQTTTLTLTKEQALAVLAAVDHMSVELLDADILTPEQRADSDAVVSQNRMPSKELARIFSDLAQQIYKEQVVPALPGVVH